MKDLLAKERDIVQRLTDAAARREAAQQRLEDMTREVDELVAEAIDTTRISVSRLARIAGVSRQTIYKRVVWRSD